MPVQEPLEHIKAELRFVRFHGEDSGFTVATFFLPEAARTITAVGTMAQPRASRWYLLWGCWARHPEYGEQFQFERYELCAPATREAAVRYLASGAIEGVGQEFARRLVAHFGTQVTEVLDKEPERLDEVKGIGPKKLKAIIASWQKEKNAHQTMMFLLGHGIGPRLAVRIYKKLREKTVQAVSENPYLLIREVEGIGFATADKIASSLGIAPDAPQRLTAGAIYTLQRALEDGHVFLPREVLVREAQRLLGAEEMPVERAVQAEVEAGGVVADQSLPEEAVYLPPLHAAEKAAAAHVFRLLKPAGPGSPAAAEVPEDLVWRWARGETTGFSQETDSSGMLQEPKGAGLPPALSAEQVKAVSLALSSKVSIVTGGPGVGKTTAARAIVELAEQAGAAAKLASPTGRAAKRLSEATGRPAQTIHRLLDFDPFTGIFRRDEKSLLSADLVLVDEASMLDLALACALLGAIPDRARLVFVGDVDQLPSVGPGLFLKDLIASGCVPVARLTEIFRQARESLIVTNAHRVNRGQWPALLPTWNSADCVFIEEPDAVRLVDRLKDLCCRLLPEKGFAADDIQILTPMNKGQLGTIALNRILQQALNPPSPLRAEMARGQRLSAGLQAAQGIFREGDRVIQTVNNYQRGDGVFNGDIGRIIRIDEKNRRLWVEFPEQTVDYSSDDLDELELAYALSVHKAQGSEFPAAIAICHTSQWFMLQRNLFYTALTRARRLAVIIGERRAVGRAVRNDREVRRHSALAWRLREFKA